MKETPLLQSLGKSQGVSSPLQLVMCVDKSYERLKELQHRTYWRGNVERSMTVGLLPRLQLSRWYPALNRKTPAIHTGQCAGQQWWTNDDTLRGHGDEAEADCAPTHRCTVRPHTLTANQSEHVPHCLDLLCIGFATHLCLFMSDERRKEKNTLHKWRSPLLVEEKFRCSQSPLSSICDPQQVWTNLLHDQLPKDVDEPRPSTEVVDRMQGQQTKDALEKGYQAFSLHGPTTQAVDIEPSQPRFFHHQIEIEAEPTWDEYFLLLRIPSEWCADIDGEMHPNGGD